MVIKTKNKNSIVSHIGVIAMVAATFISMAELAEREGGKVAATLQPNYAFATQPVDGQGHSDEMIRRSKEEIGHSSTSYGTVRRSHSVTGTL